MLKVNLVNYGDGPMIANVGLGWAMCALAMSG
jgi:hypothetical protein